MAQGKNFCQYRYKTESANIEDPELLIKGTFTGGKKIIQLGIQTLPGVAFSLNGATNTVIVGSTGIFELDVDGITTIASISFVGNSIDKINKAPDGYLIIDIIYINEEATT